MAIDRTSKFAFVQLVTKTGRASASAFLVALIEAVPYKIHTVLTDNGIQFAGKTVGALLPARSGIERPAAQPDVAVLSQQAFH